MKRILKTIIFKLKQQTTKPNENYPACKALAQYIFFSVNYVFSKQARPRLKAAFYQE